MIDLHAHPSLPLLGTAWRRGVQGFRPPAFEAGEPAGKASPGDGPPAPGHDGLRGYGAAFYETYLLRPEAARKRLFRSLAAFRTRLRDADRGGQGDPAAPSIRLLLSASDLKAAVSSPASEACFLAVESMRYLRDPGDVARLWEQGVRSLQPIHFLDTRWGGSSREGLLPESRTGLTGPGREMLAEMARLGMILDLAHMSRRNAEACLAAYPGPVMCSHTGLRSLKPVSRNLSEELAEEIFRRQGIVGVTCWKHLLGPPPSPGKGPDSPRAAWTRAYCATIAAFADLSPGARVCVGSDRGAPILVPAWFYGPDHRAEMETCLAGLGWDPDRRRAFFSGHALEFLARSLPA